MAKAQKFTDVLLPSEQTSPRQFEKLSVILSSNEIGVFMLDIVTPTNQVVGSCEVKMEDLLQAKFENKVTLDMFDQVARVRVNTLIFLINKSESSRITAWICPDSYTCSFAEFYA
jgi:Ras GTPase-activating-like protein IQGAP2/3